MASLFANLHTEGNTYRVLHCAFGVQQATRQRGRASARVRYELVQVLLEVPTTDALLAWAATAAKHVPADIVFLNAAGGRALETLHLPTAYCVAYREEFSQGDDQNGAYLCHLTLSSPSGWTLEAGGPAMAIAAAESLQPSSLALASTLAIGGGGSLPVDDMAASAAAAAHETAITALVDSVKTGAASRIATMSVSQRGPCYSGIYDPLTQQTQYGENFNMTKAAGRAAYAKFYEEAHPVVRSRIDAQKEALHADKTLARPTSGTPGAHSEVVALDKILKAREAHTGQPATSADVAELYLHNRSTLNSLAGQPMDRCDNCRPITAGINTIGHN